MKKLLFSMLALLMGFTVMTQAQNSSVAAGGEAVGNNGKMSFTIGQVACQFTTDQTFNFNEGVQQAHPEDHMMINTVISGLGDVDGRNYSNFIKVGVGADTLFRILPVEGWHVEKVTVNGWVMGAIDYFQFENVKEDQLIEVEFAIDQYTITASKIGNGTITDEGVTSLTYDNAISYPYTITPDTGYSILAIVVNNQPLNLEGIDIEKPFTYTFNNMLGDSTITALFGKNQYAIVATSNKDGVLNPNGPVAVGYGENRTYQAKANVGHYIAKVSIDTAVTEYTQEDNLTDFSYTFSNIIDNHTLDVQFAICHYDVVATQGSNGKISPDATKNYAYGESPVYTITPAEGFEIADVLVDGNSVGAVATYKFSNIKENHTITAKYNQLTYTIIASTSNNGTITPAGTTVVKYGAKQVYTMKPNAGYSVASVLVDGENIGKVTAYTFENIKENHTINVVYAINTFDIVATANAGGTITPAGKTTVEYGATQSYEVVADFGYTLTALKIDNKPVDLNKTTLPYEFKNVDAHHTIEAVFTINQYTIRAAAGDGGTITPAGAKMVKFGENQVYNMKANDGFYIDYVMVDGIKVGPKEKYEFKKVSDNHTIEVAFLAEVCETPNSLMTTNITDSSAKFAWKGFADKYTVRYKAENEAEFVELTNITDLSVDVKGLTAETNYVWNVIGYCTYGSVVIASDTAETSFVTLKKETGSQTGIDDNALASVKVYSYQDKVYINNEQNIAVKNVEIFDATGRVVYCGGALQSSRTEIQLSVAAGNYVVRLISDENTAASYKVMITNY